MELGPLHGGWGPVPATIGERWPRGWHDVVPEAEELEEGEEGLLHGVDEGRRRGWHDVGTEAEELEEEEGLLHGLHDVLLVARLVDR